MVVLAVGVLRGGVCVCVWIPNSSNATPHQEIRLQRSTTLKTNISPGHSCLELICGLPSKRGSGLELSLCSIILVLVGGMQ